MLRYVEDAKGREPPQSGGYAFPCVSDVRGEPPQSGGYTLPCVGDAKGREPPQLGGYAFPCVGDAIGGEPPQLGGYALPRSSACIYKKNISEMEVKKYSPCYAFPCVGDARKPPLNGGVTRSRVI